MKYPVLLSGFSNGRILKGEKPMGEYSARAVERAMKIQGVILRAISGQLL
jgi:hypothetical protein